jgi:hypothetical protein
MLGTHQLRMRLFIVSVPHCVSTVFRTLHTLNSALPEKRLSCCTNSASVAGFAVSL